MPDQFDAFGRPVEPPHSPDGAASRRSTTSAVADRPRDPRRPAWRLPYLLVLLVVGGGAVVATLSAATEWANDQPRTHAVALERDPFGARSLLRPEAMVRAVDRALAEARPDERVASVNAWPTRVLVTLFDPREQARWVQVDTAEGVRVTNVSGTGSPATSTVTPARATIDPAPALARLRRRWTALQPYARDPSLALVIDGSGKRATGWLLSVDGVRSADRTLVVDRAGRARR